MTCLIIEDQLPAQRILQRYVDQVDDLECVGSFTDPVAALAYLKENDVDLLFLDIHLPKISGMEFLEILPKRPHVILTTAFSEYALKGYEFSVVDYLLKPISLDRFQQAVEKVFKLESLASGQAGEVSTAAGPDHLFVKADRTIYRINIEDIVYIKADEDFTHLHTQDQHYFLSHNLKHWETTLPPDRFCRIHKSYLVNIDRVRKIESNQVFTELGEVPIGRSYREQFMQRVSPR
ncbi:LytTR family DNA-binding domain-containing protein [Lewinella sp. W8]|uniref:LytR/AlgR family response regulator transcription factor n=1 Tax=Lewinella sp. W8 TaxID=2528208 RepID=UPI0010689FF2|nr:LytTR family DNA-binding domain-containing protein [Lewinella sp. W8]MTB50209.1 response regulator [Lewinella sp. W8]